MKNDIKKFIKEEIMRIDINSFIEWVENEIFSDDSFYELDIEDGKSFIACHLRMRLYNHIDILLSNRFDKDLYNSDDIDIVNYIQLEIEDFLGSIGR